MKRILRAARQGHSRRAYACHSQKANRWQHREPLNAQESELECDRFFALSSDILGVAGFDGYFKRLSPACERILGFSQHELLTTPFIEFVHPSDRAATMAVGQRLGMGERVDHFENRYRCKDGSYKWLSWSGIGVVEEELIYCTVRDVTTYKEAEATLQQSKQYYESLIHSLNGIVWEYNLQTQQFVFVSQKAGDILGYPVAQWSSEAHFWENHIHPEDREWVIQGCHQLVLQRQEGQLEYRMIAADGRVVWLHDIVSLVLEAEQPTNLRGVLIDITELQATKEILHRREQEFRALVENSPDVIVRVDRNFRHLYANPKIEEKTGIPAAAYIGKTSQELGLPDDLVTPWHSAAQRVFETQQEQWLEFESNSPAGYSCNHSRLVPEFAADGSVQSVLIVVRDITEHKQLEKALQESEARFRAFMQYSPTSAWINDSEGRIIYVNEHCRQLSQHLAADPIGKMVLDIYPAEIAQPLLDNVRQVVETRQILEAIETVPKADGTVGEFLVYKFPIPSSSETCLVGGVAVDITELKRTEAALRESEERFRQIAESIREVFWIADIEFNQILYVSPAYEEVWGRTCQSLYEHPRSFIEAIHLEDRTHILGVVEQQRLTGFKHEYRIVYPDGSIRWIWEQAFTVNDARGNPYRLVGTSQDITDRKLVEAALRYQREQEQLIMAIAQQIRQSLNLEDVLSVTVDKVQQALKADRVLVLHLYGDGAGSVVKEAMLSEYPTTEGTRWLNQCCSAECYENYRAGHARIVLGIPDDEDACFEEFRQAVGVKSEIIAPIIQTMEGTDESCIWGFLMAQACADQRQWQPMEAELLQRLASSLAIAIQQAELHQQVQQLNANLELQVQERTLELRQALAFEALLKRITDKVRDSLDEAQILQTAVQELAIGLKVQCCDTALYDFEQASSTVRFEYIISDLATAKGQTFLFSNLPGVYNQLLQGQYVQFSIIASPDPWRGESTPYFTILSCPLMDDQGVLGDLWLFRSCESSFNPLEIRLVEQVANHCAIALRQSRLYQAAQSQVTELERLSQLKDDFLSTVSHELRTPMSNIKMAIQMLEVMRSKAHSSQPLLSLDSERADRYFNILQNECQREIELINDLLDLARLDAGVEPLSLATIDLQIWIPHLLEPFEQRIASQQQQLQIGIPTTVLPITTDLSYLERILTELLNNACKYTPAGEQIGVSVTLLPEEASELKTTSPSVSITVCNSGVEIPSSELAHIFDKFYRIPNNDPWKHGGTGLGLALVKRLVERLDGKMEVSSGNQQTRFMVQLPLVTLD